MERITVEREYPVGDMLLRFCRKGKVLDFSLIPASMKKNLVPHRTELEPCHAAKAFLQLYKLDPGKLDPMIQFKVRGEADAGEHYPGRSMRNSESSYKTEFVSQEAGKEGVSTVFRHPSGLRLEHWIEFGGEYLMMSVRAVNEGKNPVTLEYLSSFSLGMLSPFRKDDGLGKYRIHRLQSVWAAEGRPEVRTAEDLNLEMSWQAAGLRNLRFGQNGTMPVREYFPFVAFEDSESGVMWGAQVFAAGSWELEVSRTGDFFHLSGGYPGRETGEWSKVLKPGESFETLKTAVTCVKGGIDDLTERLLKAQEKSFRPSPADKAMPVMYNEFCRTWGKPYPESLNPALDFLKGWPVKYFVLDAGWFHDSDEKSPFHMGDWEVAEERYPKGGFGKFVDSIAKRGFIPGVWFEFENASDSAVVVKEHPDWFLRLDGELLKSGPRVFFDFRKSEVTEYLAEKVIAFLKKYHFGYMKVDYNAPTAGLCDGPESPAENHRLHLAAVEEFYCRIKRELPELVLEVCASGGHRLTPEWMSLCDMASFSDAHEGVDIPLIAANVRRMIPARKSQVWITIREWDDEDRLYYLCAGGFLGRFCLSGDPEKLSEKKAAVVRAAMDFYPRIAEIVRSGKSKLLRKWNNHFSKPEGWQIAEQTGESGTLLVLHTFAKAPEKLKTALRGREIVSVFAPKGVRAAENEGKIEFSGLRDFTAAAVLLKKRS